MLAGLELASLRAASALVGLDRAYSGALRLSDRWYDWRTGLDTGGIISQSDLGLEPQAGRNYAATTPRAWRLVMGRLQIEPSRFTYVDLGCGKGRTLILAAKRGFKRVIGVDLSKQMAQIAEANILRSGVTGAEVVCGDAAEFEFPDDPLVLFLFNPFWREVNERVAQNLHASLSHKPRQAYVAYWRPRFREVWDQIPSLELTLSCDALYPWYAIYMSR
ncbi:MAG: methyltransferase domain-containing protein [Acidobacteriota bacterium]|nr:methyltransferase domain-containing protein [Acidobacteriota bacterium]